METPTYLANLKSVQDGIPVYKKIVEEEALDPMKMMTEGLMKLLADNKDTEYGRKYDFASITSVEEYQKRVPVITYDDIAGMIDRMAAGEKDILTAYPFGHFNTTSGSVGAQKMIPLTDRMQAAFAKYNKAAIDGLKGVKMDPEWMHGRTMCTSQGNYTRLPSGITRGSASSVMVDYIGGRDIADKFMRTIFTSPVDATSPKPGVDATYLHTRFWLEDEDCSGILTGFFSTVTILLKYIKDHIDVLIQDIEKGTIDSSIMMPDEVRASVQSKIAPNPSRAAQLREIFKNGPDVPFIPLVWPKLKFISGAGADGFSVFDQKISDIYGAKDLTRIYSGVCASEGVFSLPIELNCPDSLIVAGAGFIEFLPVKAGDDFSQIVTVDKLQEGETYEIIITNFAGLYRYRMSDAVQCTGWYKGTPLVQFMYRVNKTVNLICEKTTEKALNLAVENASKELGITLREFTLYPNVEVSPFRYDFMLETEDGTVPEVDTKVVAKHINEWLCKMNQEYEYLNKVKPMLGMPDVKWLEKGTNDKYVYYLAADGVSPSQIKPVRIISNEKQRSFYFKFRINNSGMNKAKALETVQPSKSTCASILENCGFAIEKDIAGIKDSFVARYGNASPTVALIAEYDESGLITKGTFSAALAIRNYLEQYPDRGTVAVFGCPKDDTSTQKVIMAKEGYFDDIDVALSWHPSSVNMVTNATTAAMRSLDFTFCGSAQSGDAIHLMNAGVNCLLAQVAEIGRINYSEIHVGGSSATVNYWIRTYKRKDLEPVVDRVRKIAEGAALMSDTQLSAKVVGGCSGFAPNIQTSSALYANLLDSAEQSFTAEELSWAAEARKNADAGIREVKSVVAKIEERRVRENLLAKLEESDIFTPVIPLFGAEINGITATDLGDVSRICPTGQLNIAAWPVGINGGASPIAEKATLKAAEVLAGTTIDFFENPCDVVLARKDHEFRTSGHKYECPF